MENYQFLNNQNNSTEVEKTEVFIGNGHQQVEKENSNLKSVSNSLSTSTDFIDPKVFPQERNSNNPHVLIVQMKPQAMSSSNSSSNSTSSSSVSNSTSNNNNNNFPSEFSANTESSSSGGSYPTDSSNFKSSLLPDSDQKIMLPTLKKMKLNHPSSIGEYERNENVTSDSEKEKKFYAETENLLLSSFQNFPETANNNNNSTTNQSNPVRTDDNKVFKRLSYQAMITNAIMSTEKQSATNRDIITYLETHYMDILKKKQGDWQKTCRSVLSVHFLRVYKSGSKSEWQIKPPSQEKKKSKKAEKEQAEKEATLNKMI